MLRKRHLRFIRAKPTHMDDLIIPFYLFLNKFVTLSRAEFEEIILPHVVVRRFDAKEVITGIGTIENYFNFLLSGLSRSYYLKETRGRLGRDGLSGAAQGFFHVVRELRFEYFPVETPGRGAD